MDQRIDTAEAFASGRPPTRTASTTPTTLLNRVAPTSQQHRLAVSIERAIWRETGGRVRDLVVEVTREQIVLRGHCNTFYIKQKAQQAAMPTDWSMRLVNQIEVT